MRDDEGSIVVMKRILQSLRSGETEVADVPVTACGRGMLKMRTCEALISAGTNRMLVVFSKGGFWAKPICIQDRPIQCKGIHETRHHAMPILLEVLLESSHDSSIAH